MVYLADTSAGLRLIDVSDPSRPTIVSTIDTPGGAHNVAISGGVAFVADTSSDP